MRFAPQGGLEIRGRSSYAGVKTPEGFAGQRSLYPEATCQYKFHACISVPDLSITKRNALVDSFTASGLWKGCPRHVRERYNARPSSHVSFGMLGEPLPSVTQIFSQEWSCGLVLRNLTATARACVTSSGSVDPNESDQIRDPQRDMRSIRHDHRRQFAAT